MSVSSVLVSQKQCKRFQVFNLGALLGPIWEIFGSSRDLLTQIMGSLYIRMSVEARDH